MENKLQELNLASLGQEYAKVTREIKQIRKQILNSLKIDIQELPEENTNFLTTITESIDELNKRFSGSELANQLSEKDIYLKEIMIELEKRKKELFDNLDMSLIPIDKLPIIDAFLSKYQNPSYREQKWKQISLSLLDDQFDLLNHDILDTSINDLELNTRVHFCLMSANLHTLWDIWKMYKEQHNTLRLRNFWNKSLEEIENVFREKGLLI